MPYPDIAEHGLVGDLQTAALVATDGTVDWLCLPRFDSPSVFGALLDDKRGGSLRTRPARGGFATKQLYFPDTAVLITRFMADAGVVELMDFMPVVGDGAGTGRHRFVRLLRCVRGEMAMTVDVSPRFNYGRQEHQVKTSEEGVEFFTDDEHLTVHVVREPGDEVLGETYVDEHGDAHVEVSLRAGMVRGLVLESSAGGPPRAHRVAEVEELLQRTVDVWRRWLARCTYRGRWREMVDRSAITLKLMTYEPTGALVAAPTTSLPEQMGGKRNWDYRFTWIRDSSFSVFALLGLGFTDEAAAFGSWLADRIRDRTGRGDQPLDIMYRVDGASDLDEEVLDHWEGYRGSAPVRVGNGAMGQLQLDIYGEAMDSLYAAGTRGIAPSYEGWQALVSIIDWLCEHWDQADEGIWETRGGRRDFTYGRLMSWVALDRAVRAATDRGLPAPVADWRAQRDTVYRQIMTRAWSPTRKAFAQHYGSDVLDSSLLRMAPTGFIAPNDPRWQETLDAMAEDLVSDSLVYRYDPFASPDGLQGSEGTFSLCTFWYVDALAQAGRVDDARLVFEKMLTYANHLGLYAEEVDPSGMQIGNFPQAFTHLALIIAALRLDAALDARRVA